MTVQIDQASWQLAGKDKVRITLGKGRSPNRWTEVGRLEVTFHRDHPDTTPPWQPDRIASVNLTLTDGITASAAQRFPWARWLAVANAAIRTSKPRTRSRDDKPWERAIWLTDPQATLDTQREVIAALGKPVPDAYKKHPGRRGHTDEHFKLVAATYRELVRQGVTNPVKTIADQWGYSRDTVASWVYKARKKKLLPPTTPGKSTGR